VRRIGFTLVELLVVIAIISILSMIAVPNFLHAQIRAKVSRVHADQRTLATAIETYHVDWGKAPIYGNANDGVLLNYSDHDGERTFIPYRLTTPVAYITSLPTTPFQAAGYTSADYPNTLPFTYFYRYYCAEPDEWEDYPGPGTRADNTIYGKQHAAKAERLNQNYDCYNHKGFFFSRDSESNVVAWMVASPGPVLRCEAIQRAMQPQYTTMHTSADYPDLRYDVTNGSSSVGDILRFNAQ
jgi:prepilin-type N-terminal cleavage/methylation domain-containing protein